MKYCAKCGATNGDESTKCSSCGSELGTSKAKFKGTMIMGGPVTAAKPSTNPVAGSDTQGKVSAPKPGASTLFMGAVAAPPTPSPLSTPPATPLRASPSSPALGSSPLGSSPSSPGLRPSGPHANPSAPPPSPSMRVTDNKQLGHQATLLGGPQVAPVPPRPAPNAPTQSAPAQSAPAQSATQPKAYANDIADVATHQGSASIPPSGSMSASVKEPARQYANPSVEMAGSLMPPSNQLTLEQWIVSVVHKPWFRPALFTSLAVLVIAPLLALTLSFYTLSHGGKVNATLRAEQLRISSTVTLGSIKRACKEDGSGKKALAFVHASAQSKLQPALCAIDDDTIRLFGSPEHSQATLAEGTDAESMVDEADLDADNCVLITGGTAKLVGCETEEQGFTLLHINK